MRSIKKIISTSTLLISVFTILESHALDLAAVNDVQTGALQSPALDGDINAATDALSAVIGSNKDEVTLQLGKVFSNNFIGNFSITSPVKNENQPVQFGNLDGLTNKARVNFSLQFGGPKELVTNSTSEAFQEKLDLCEEYALEQNQIFDRQSVAADDSCNLDTFEGNRQYQRRFFNTVLKPESFKYNFYGIEGSVAHDSYDYFTEENLTQKQSETENDYSLKLYGGRFINPWTYITGAVRYEDSHRAGNEQQICLPFGTEGAQSCNEVIIGAPTQTERTVVSLSYGTLNENNTAFQLNLSRDVDNDITGVSVPVWFIKGRNGGLLGGVQLDWDSDSEDFSAFVFANVPFNLP